ncbi:MAG: ABC transporter ATP-binding protein [Betaproteobacteria bacterium]|nr:ABC transporter ATP-binding protein [Betaproteobacteria bacterium]MBI2509795.1 ABC transporter ATP-binding protein [Betaproteobacteria bacterium]
MSDAVLRFAQVTKGYAGVPVLSDFTLEVQRGEFFALAGVNGAGKTTLIKCLLDFCDTNGGGIEIFGVPHRATASRARLAYLPERFNPPFYLTGRDFLHYLLKLHGAPYEEALVTRMFGALDLESSALDRLARAYSKGMTQKLGLAACLLSGKDLYVLDEPTGGLDPKARALLKGELRELKRAGRTVFFTSHALADIAEICDRMAVLHGGRLRFAGTPRELMGRYGARDLEQAFLACIAA